MSNDVDNPISSNMPRSPSTTLFGPFAIPLRHIFYTSRTQLSHALVNLRPLLPGHVLVIPARVVPRYSELSLPETADLALTVRKVARLIERVYAADALNIAVQDGEAAGQSVGHVHFHLIPRKAGDFDQRGGGDRIYEVLEQRGGEADVGQGLADRGKERKRFAALDADRRPRSDEEMEREAAMLRREMEKEVEEEGGA